MQPGGHPLRAPVCPPTGPGAPAQPSRRPPTLTPWPQLSPPGVINLQVLSLTADISPMALAVSPRAEPDSPVSVGMPLQTPVGLKRLPLFVLAAVAVCTLMPLLLHAVGVNYGPPSHGGAGSHYAGVPYPGGIVRLDVAAAGLLLFLSILGVMHYRVSPNRYVNLMTGSLLLGGLAMTVQFVPCAAGPGRADDFLGSVVTSTTLGHLGAGLLLLVGAGFLNVSRGGKTWRGLLVPAATGGSVLLLIWAAMAGRFGDLTPHRNHLQVATLGLYLVLGVLLRPQLQPRVLRFLKLGLLGMLIPLAAGLLWLQAETRSALDLGFHIAALLWWLALLLPVLGLGIDFINVYYGKGLAGERRFLRRVVDTIPHFIFARGADGRFTLVNKAVADFYGQSVTQLEGRHLSEIHADPVQRDLWLKEDLEILREGRPVTMLEAETHDAAGKPMWIEAIKTPLPGRHSDAPQVLGISIDITRQKQAEIALADRLKFEQTATLALQQFIKCTVGNFDQRIVGILETVARFAHASRCGIYRISDPDGHAQLLHSWLEKPADQGTVPPTLIAPGDLVWLGRWFALGKHVAVACLEDLPPEAAGFRNDWGPTRSSALLLLPIHYQGRLFGFLGLDSSSRREWSPEETALLRNIADLYITVWTKLETEKDLTRAMEQAQASSRAKSEFLANMSHEIRTPMNCVIGISDLLMEMDPSPIQQQYLEMISHSGASLLTLINDILDLSKIEAGQLELDPVETNLREMVEEVAGLIAFHAQAKGLEMVCRYAPGAPDRLICDPNRLRQVLTNLLNNAVKFTRDGHIYLNVEPVGRRDDRLELQFQVADTGIGIPEAKLEKIFEKFTQADASTTRRFGGTGLGLSISQQLVKLMGGVIKADSIEGRGSTFTFTLPVVVVEESLQAPGHMGWTGPGVLVISRHELGCEVLAEQVRHLGCPCQTVLGWEKGKELLEAVAGGGRDSWSHLLVDQDVLPAETAEIRQVLEALPTATRPQLVLMTSLSSILREADLNARGVTCTLTKPVRPVRLAQVLRGEAGADPTLVVPIPAEVQAQATCRLDLELESDDDASLHRPVILLAEDNPFNQKVAVGMLNLLGCRVEVAGNGVEALAKVQDQAFDLIFMDCQMPEMDGYEATRRIRSLSGPRSATTIVAMTANALSGDRVACFDAGMNDFLSKPITKAMLGEMLARWELLRTPVSS